MEALVGALGAALAREHPGRQLGGALEGEDAGGVGEGAGDVLQEEVAEDAGPGLPLGELDLGHLGAGQRGGGERDVDLAAAHGVGELAAGELLADPRPGADQLARVVLELLREAADLGVEVAELRLAGDLGGGDLLEQVPQVLGGAVALAVREDGAGAGQLVELGRHLDLVGGPLLVVAHGVGDLAQVAGAVAGDHRVALRLAGGDGGGALQRPGVAVLGGQAAHQPLVEGVDAVVVELAGDGGVDRQLGVLGSVEEGVGAAVLLAHVAQGVERHRPVELVDGHEVGVVEHVDLLELHGGAVLGGHDVEREIGDVDDLAVGLADAGALDDDQVEARRLADRDRVLDVLGAGRGGPGGWRASA